MSEWEILLNFCYCGDFGVLYFCALIFCIIIIPLLFLKIKEDDRALDFYLLKYGIAIIVALVFTSLSRSYLEDRNFGSSFVLDKDVNLVKVYTEQNWIVLRLVKGKVLSYERRNFVAYNGDYELCVSFGGEFLPVYLAVKEYGCVEEFIRQKIKQNIHLLATIKEKPLFFKSLEKHGIVVLSISKMNRDCVLKL